MSVELSPTYSRSYALVVGIDAYTDPRFAPLGEAEADAGRFADLLESPPYNFHVKRLLGRDATRSAILNALYDLRGTDPDDRVVVYFACHGYTTVDRNGHETGYLAAVDTLPDRDFTAIELETVLDLRRHAGAKHIGFIFDACFSGAALGLTRSPAAAAGAFLTRRAYQVISAGAGDQTVSDFNSMTDLLVEQLDPAAADTSDLLTLSEVGLAVQRAMAYDSKQMQIPQFGHVRGSQGGEFVFFMESAAAAENAPEPPSSEYEPSTTPPEAVTRRETQPPPPAFIAGGVFGALVLLMLALVIIFGPESYSAGEQTATALAAGTGVATQEPGTVEPTGTAEPTAPPTDIPITPGPQPIDTTNIGDLAPAITVQLPGQDVSALAFSPDSTRLAYAVNLAGEETPQSGSVFILDLQTGESTALDLGNSNVGIRDLDWQGTTLALIAASPAADDEHVIVFDTRTLAMRFFREITRGQQVLAVKPGGDRVAIGTFFGSVLVVDAESGRVLYTDEITDYPVNGLAWKPESNTLTVAYGSAAEEEGFLVDILLSGVAAGENVPDTGTDTESYDPNAVAFLPFTAVTYSMDGARLASGDLFGSVQVWDATRREIVSQRQIVSGSVRAVAFSPDGDFIAVAGEAGTGLNIVDAGTLSPIVRLPGEGLRAAWSVDDLTIATFGADGERTAVLYQIIE